MVLPSKKSVAISVIFSLLCGVALAFYELDNLNRAINSAKAIGRSVADGLGGQQAQEVMTVKVALCFGLIPLGQVENPFRTVAIGDFLLGTFGVLSAISLGWILRRTFHRKQDTESAVNSIAEKS